MTYARFLPRPQTGRASAQQAGDAASPQHTRRHGLARTLATALLATLAALPLLQPTNAQAQVGAQRMTWQLPNAAGTGTTAAPGLIFYPTAAAASAQQWGPFAVNVAPGAAPTAGRHPLVLISHGTGGNELGHAWLAQALAADGYLVLALRHPGDDYQDRSGVSRPDYFARRPQQVSQVLDQLLADPRWAALIDRQRIAAFGHSAGGHTVLALAGARLDPQRIARHCGAQGVGLDQDATVCRLGGFNHQRPAVVQPDRPALPAVADARIRAVVADAPMTMALDPASFASLPVHVLLQYGERDSILVPRFHFEPLCAVLPTGHCVRSAQAGHFASFQTGTGPLGPPADDPAADPVGFDRLAWQAQAWPRIRSFLASSLSSSPGAALAARP